ncbi:M23 family metallopeptidase [Chlorobium sp. BLA1]|uniref:M23 family metallopeptidase n=1 Tax=Candidatus Chlorobium masyuteum TaxID=2716876 RepID=UPI001423FCC9|nr:M23 family metallopeptidase [Candidatus Chlorobium masyuteum]NHQ59151.1 M23 family metallopeptidase [Candidatus Chlorobium masyuteum]NTU44244.1 M23 family metallopeptidase [Chlorobiaceae bacterium]
MSSNTRFMIRNEYVRKVKNSFFSTPFSVTPVLALLLLSLLLQSPRPLHAEEKQPAATKTSDSPKSTEGLLASTEQMIEHLILQIERQRESAPETGELSDNPRPTSFFASIPNIKPLSGSISSKFGVRVHPIYNVPLFHSGIDFAAAEGSRVKSTGDGIVAFSGYDRGYGQKITINHGYGYKTIYGHLSKALVRQGQRVKRGDIIALSGNTGVSTGPHLHYEVRKNNLIVNPTAYFFDEANPDKFITTKDASAEESGNNS